MKDADGLSQSEAATVVAELYDFMRMSYSEIAACFPKNRAWVEERYEEHRGFHVGE